MEQLNDISGQYFDITDLHELRSKIVSSSVTPILNGMFLGGRMLEGVVQLARESPKIARYFPSFGLNTIDGARRFFSRLYDLTRTGYQFSYVVSWSNFVTGFIIVNTPALNKVEIGIEKWSMDFMLFERYEGMGIMVKAVASVLNFLKDEFRNINDILFIMDPQNDDARLLLGHLAIGEMEDISIPTIINNRQKKIFHSSLTNKKFTFSDDPTDWF